MFEDSWIYSPEVEDHFFHPRNLCEEDEPEEFDGVGEVGSMACGDIMKMWIKVKDDRIIDCKWKTFGCASALASTSMLSEIVTEKGGMKLEDAIKIKPNDIVERLGGLPQRKIHCSVLGDQAIQAAIKDYEKKV